MTFRSGYTLLTLCMSSSSRSGESPWQLKDFMEINCGLMDWMDLWVHRSAWHWNVLLCHFIQFGTHLTFFNKKSGIIELLRKIYKKSCEVVGVTAEMAQ
jgi:hypothetical protein